MNYNIPSEYEQAMNVFMSAHEKVKNDPSRPKYHFVSPANLLIDVWGAICHEDYYHLFYDTNYNNDPRRLGGTFGHLRSRDLLSWENLPFALMPDETVGELGLNDGTVVIDPSEKPLMYYTRCFMESGKNREHLAVRGSDDLIAWKRMQGDIGRLTMENHGGPTFHYSWSDPIIFSESGRTFMIISKCYPQDTSSFASGVIPIYEATDDSWLNWEYKGIFADHTGEVLNFIKIGEKWVLIYSPYDNPRYFVGNFDLDTCRFTTETEGILSYGYVQQGNSIEKISRGFYATASFYDRDKTPSIIGWLSGFDGDGWDGCVSLPRELSLDGENRLLMNPHRELLNLRMEKRLPNPDNTINCGKCFELDLILTRTENGTAEIVLPDCFTLTVTDSELTFNDITMPYESFDAVNIRMYADVSVAEVFIDGGKASLARCFPMIKDDNALLTIRGDYNVNECVLYTLKQ